MSYNQNYNNQGNNQGYPSFPEPGRQANNQQQDYNQQQGYNQGQNYNQQPNYNQGQNYNQQPNYNQQQNYNQQGNQGHFSSNNNQGNNNSGYNSGQGSHNDSPFNFTSRDGVFSGDVNGQNISLSACNGNKKALLIGINYFKTKAELKGCINDVNNIANALLPRFNFNPNNVTILTDDQNAPNRIPNYDNIIGAMKWLVEGARPGDSLFLHYSGHGGTERDTGSLTGFQDGDEEDGFDETILPLDYQQRGQISDDLLFDILVKPLPKGVRLTAIFDSCHSGSVLDLPFTYKHDGSIEVTASDSSNQEMAMTLLKAGLSFSKGDKAAAISSLFEGLRGLVKGPKKKNNPNAAKKKTDADVIQFAGCRDDQTSADARINNQATGAMSHALIQTLRENPSQTYLQLLNNLRGILSGKYTQIPQISTGYPMDLKNPFFM